MFELLKACVGLGGRSLPMPKMIWVGSYQLGGGFSRLHDYNAPPTFPCYTVPAHHSTMTLWPWKYKEVGWEDLAAIVRAQLCVVGLYAYESPILPFPNEPNTPVYLSMESIWYIGCRRWRYYKMTLQDYLDFCFMCSYDRLIRQQRSLEMTQAQRKKTIKDREVKLNWKRHGF